MDEITGKPLSILIREFNMDDYDELIYLWSRAKLPYKPEGRDKKESIKSELDRENSIFFVAEFNNKLIGSIFGTHDGRKGWINRLAVDPEYRLKCVARKLISVVEKKLYGKGIEIIACLIEDWNGESIKFFEKMGYIQHPDIIYLTKRKYPEV
jgi:GNAT superfamily N-acetyltransferase